MIKISSQLEYDIISTLNKVFDNEGNMRLCGREECINLTSQIYDLSLLKESEIQSPALIKLRILAGVVPFGDIITGFINLSELKAHGLYDILTEVLNENM